MYEQGERLDLASNQGAAANSAALVVMGGSYALHVEGTLGTASFLQVLHPSGNWVNWGSAVTADTLRSLPPGQVRFTTGGGAAAVYVWLTRISAQAVADELIIQGNLDSRYVLKSGDTMTGALALPNGSVSAPSLAFNTNYGLFYDSTNVGLGFTAGGGSTTKAVFSDVTPLGLTVFTGVDVASTIGANLNLKRAVDSTSPTTNTMQKARGTIAAPTAVLQNDLLGLFQFSAYTGAAFVVAGRYDCSVVATTPSATDLESRFLWRLMPAGSATLTETMRLQHAIGISMYGANVVIDQNRVHRPLSTTVAGVPTATATGLVEFSNEAGRSGLGYSDGSAWRRVGDNQVASATVDYRGVWSNLSARYPQSVQMGGGMSLAIIQTVYDRLNAAGLLSKLLGLWVHCMANQTDALLNWITPGTRNMTIIGSPTFTANQGFTGDGSSALLSTSATGTVFGATQDNFCVGCFVRAASASAAAVIGQTASSRRTYMQSRTSGAITSRLSNTTADTFTPARYTGQFVMSRGVSTDYDVWLDDGAPTNIVRTSNANGAGITVVFLGTTDATGNEFSTAQLSYSFIATDLSTADVTNLRAILEDFMLVQVGAITPAVANLPPAANFKANTYYIPDLGGGTGLIASDGVNWERMSRGLETRSLATGSETVTYLTNGDSILYDQTLTGNTTVTLSGTDAKGSTVKQGAEFTITHNNATPGAFTFDIKDGPSATSLITFGSATNKAARFRFNGTNWKLLIDAAI